MATYGNRPGPPVELKIEEQAEFVAWWRETVTPNKGGDRKSKNQSGRPAALISNTEKLTGIRSDQVSRWRRKLKDPGKYQADLYGAAYRLYAHGIKIEEQAMLGKFLKESPRNEGAKGIGKSAEPNGNHTPRLSDIGISKKESSSSQLLSTLQAEQPEEFARIRAGKKSVTTSATASPDQPEEERQRRKEDRAGRKHDQPDRDRRRCGDLRFCARIARSAAQALSEVDSLQSTCDVGAACTQAQPCALHTAGDPEAGLREV